MPKQIGLIFLVVLLQSGVALLLQKGAKNSDEMIMIILILGLAIGLNGLRFIIWGLLHRQFDLSRTYPLTALFFPLIYAISIYQNEADFVWNKIFGLLLVFGGVFILTQEKQS